MQIHPQYKEEYVPFVFPNIIFFENLVQRSIPETTGKQMLLLHHPNILFLQIAQFLQQQLQQFEETPLLGFLMTNKTTYSKQHVMAKTAVQ